MLVGKRLFYFILATPLFLVLTHILDIVLNVIYKLHALLS